MADLPDLVTYVAFTLDPYASLRHLHDSQVDAVTKTMGTKTYVGVVGELLNILGDDPAKEWIVAELYLVSPKPPTSDDKTGFDASFFVPALPATDHPQGRAPVEPVPPLPWPGYHILENRARIRLRKLQQNPQETSKLSVDDMVRLYDMFHEDGKLLKERRKALGLNDDGELLAQEAEVDDTHPKPPSAEEEKDGPTNGARSESPSAGLEEMEESSEEGSLEIDEGAVLMTIMNADDAWEYLHPLADFAYELRNFPELADPEDLFKQVEALEKLREASDARVKEADARHASQYSFHAEDGEQPTSPTDATKDGEKPAEEPTSESEQATTAAPTSSTKKPGFVSIRVLFGRTKSVFLRVREKFFSSRKRVDA